MIEHSNAKAREEKMTIRAKYQGRCGNCGGRINVGESINWVRGGSTTHTKCPNAKPSEKIPNDAIHLSGGSGYGCNGWTPGQVIYSKKADTYLFVISASSRYIDEDGMSFGVGDEEGYIYEAVCRKATEEEAAPEIAKRAAAELKRNAARELELIAKQIRETGEKPEGQNVTEGQTIPIGAGQNIYGGGEWFVVGTEYIWYVRNNGGDGDMWAANNVRTGGAGAIGFRVPATEELAAKITNLHKSLQ